MELNIFSKGNVHFSWKYLSMFLDLRERNPYGGEVENAKQWKNVLCLFYLKKREQWLMKGRNISKWEPKVTGLAFNGEGHFVFGGQVF